MSGAMNEGGLEDAAILLMSLGEEDAAEVFRHLAPKEVQRLGETIAKMKSVSHEKVDGVLERFTMVASEQSILVADNDKYVKSVLRKALGEDKAAQERVLKDPGPSAALSAFGADGLEFTVGYWIADPENGQLNIRSAINLTILDALRRHGIEIPYPQRVLHVLPGETAVPAAPTPRAITGS